MTTARLILGDCLQVLPTLPSASVDAVITDPPWGIAARFGKIKRGGKNWPSRHHNRPIAGDDKPFDPSPWLAFPHCILWGANFFSDKLPGGGWLIWDKRRGVEEMEWSRSDAELAWQKGGKTVKMFRHLWHGLCRDSEIGEHLHPMQKPVALMRWCLSFVSDGCTVLDPYMGTGAVGVACAQLGFNFIGIEIDPTYFAIAEKRIREAENSAPLFDPPAPVQPALFPEGAA